MHRSIAIALLISCAFAPALASTVSSRAQSGDCPLVEPASAADSGPARRPAEAGDGNAATANAPVRADAPAGATRTRARWQSLLPGMIK